MNRSIFILIFICPILLTNCVTILAPRKQKVKLIHESDNTTVLLDHDSLGTSPSEIKLDLKNKISSRTIVSFKDGYKPRQIVSYPKRISPFIWGNIITLPTSVISFTIFGLDLNSPKCYLHEKQVTIPPLEKLPIKDSLEKYIWVDQTAIHINRGDTIVKYFTKEKKLLKGKCKSFETADKNAHYLNSTLSYDLNQLLIKYGFTDNSDNVIPVNWNSTYLKAEVTHIEGTSVGLVSSLGYCNFRIDINWVLYDGYGNKLYSKSTSRTSDNYIVDSNFENVITDALDYSILELLNDQELRSLLVLKQDEFVRHDDRPTSIVKPNNNSNNFEDLLSSVVRVKSKDHSSSGVVISHDGYIISSYDVLSSNDSVFVQVDDKSFPAKIQSSNQFLNVSLLKIDTSGLCPIQFPTDNFNSPALGEYLYSLSYTNINFLDKYVSRGVASGFRDQDNIEYIQTDIPLNNGNSGGLLVDSKGNAIGVINSRVSSYFTDGISFAIPANNIFEGLNIQYKTK